MLVHILIFGNSESDLKKRTAFSGWFSLGKWLMGNDANTWPSRGTQGSGRGGAALRSDSQSLFFTRVLWNGHLAVSSRAVGTDGLHVSSQRGHGTRDLEGSKAAGILSLWSVSAPCPFRDELQPSLSFLGGTWRGGGTRIRLGMKNWHRKTRRLADHFRTASAAVLGVRLATWSSRHGGSLDLLCFRSPGLILRRESSSQPTPMFHGISRNLLLK